MKAGIRVLGVQKPADRFRKDTSRHEYPKIAAWRCNLTALSQRHNLFFIAYGGQIYVYEPRFPYQVLPTDPAVVINTPSDSHLDHNLPRGINHLIVQDLGLEEVLAVARHDGDVDAYLVAHVLRAMERRTAGDEAAEVRPFLQSNVGHSAWGLAVHTNARLLAVSSNSHKVTIFYFGLIDPDGGDVLRQEHRMTIAGSTTNIPSIAFCNTGEDPEGRWLLATDILGKSRALDLRTMHTAQTFYLNDDTLLPGATHDHFHAGWSIMFLDRRSFTPISTFGHTCGMVNYSPTDRLWNVSFSREDTAPGYQREFGALQSSLDPSQTQHFPLSASPRGYPGCDSLYPIKENRNMNFCGNLPCPILCAAVKNVYLLQPAAGPLVILEDTLRQPITFAHNFLDGYDRLNMHAYIPSIGVVILASQKGRALIIGLNKLPFDEIPGCQDEVAYCMRIDAILPFPYQDQNEERPFKPLLGIAVGPIQGTERLSVGERRWRLMMTYYDHTVLSYEISRGVASVMDDVVV